MKFRQELPTRDLAGTKRRQRDATYWCTRDSAAHTRVELSGESAPTLPARQRVPREEVIVSSRTRPRKQGT